MNETDAIYAASQEAEITGKVYSVFRRKRGDEEEWTYRECMPGDADRRTHVANCWPNGHVSRSYHHA